MTTPERTSRVFYYGQLLVGVPDSCPDEQRFTDIVTDRLEKTFGGPEEAAASWRAFDRCRQVPERFEADPELKRRCQEMQMAVMPRARAWVEFHQALHAAFLNRHPDSGRDKEASMPGWQPNEILMAVYPDAPAPDVTPPSRRSVRRLKESLIRLARGRPDHEQEL